MSISEVRTDSMTDSSLDVCMNPVIYSRVIRSDMVSIFSTHANGKFITVQNGFWRDTLSRRNSFPSRYQLIDSI